MGQRIQKLDFFKNFAVSFAVLQSKVIVTSLLNHCHFILQSNSYIPQRLNALLNILHDIFLIEATCTRRNNFIIFFI